MPYPLYSPRRALRYLFLFRAIVVSLAVLGALIGWLASIPWLLAAGICIGIGEFLESTYYIMVLRWGQRRGTLSA